MANQVEQDVETGIISRTIDGNVEIHFIGMQSIEMPPEAAVRMAVLLCKRAGCEIMLRQGSMKVKFPRGFEFGNAESVAERVN